jgi:hypothetical protein
VSQRPTHIGWDRGAIAEVVDPAVVVEFGAYPPPPKTITTRCGKRVAASRIDNQAATCPAYRAGVAELARSTLELLAAHPELRRHTRDPQALVDALLGTWPASEVKPDDRRPGALPACPADAPRTRPVGQPAARSCPTGAPVRGANPELLPRTDAPPTANHPPASRKGAPVSPPTLPPIPERVAASARLLDRPGWTNQVDSERLDMTTAHDDVLGQLYGDFQAGLDHVVASPPKAQARPYSWAARHGFDLSIDAGWGDYAQLTEAWRAELACRRGGAGR